ncbi:pilus assembly protein [Rheinheimera sp. NSM]|uniref:pilus assembly protein n=1 Tax=Rheinheimera sp. NSM TaxID=3457884 RepID=UPI0040359ADE
MKQLKRYLTMSTLGITLVSPLMAEDIEIYVGSESYRQGANAKVLIIFDNSGSMRTLEEVKKAYDTTKTYTTKGYEEFSSEAIYFSRGENVDDGAGVVPNGHSDSRRFNKAILGCETAWEKLRTVGYYTGYLREYQVKGNSGSWEPLPAEMGLSTNNPVDCYDDIVNKKSKNGTYSSKYTQIPNDRYPYNGSGNAKTDLENTAYTTDWALANSQSSALQGGQPVTLYTSNYINYYHATTSDVGTESKTRLEIAKETINELLTATPGVDFGMMLFNMNYPNEGDRDGGRIVNGIKKMTDASRAALLGTLQNVDAETNTPLCESLMEAKRYYAGNNVDYGKKDKDYGNSYDGNTPPRDTSIESNGSYITPYDKCSDVVYTILITDGEPTVDAHADAAIRALSNESPYRFDNGRTNYLPVLAKWMATEDVNANLTGKQTAKLFTIGFGDDAVNDAGELLALAAKNGGGKYYAARNSAALATALQASLMEILRVNTTFTSPSVASNNFDRTRSLDSVYYAMFLPDSGTRWTGNLKKLKLKGDVLTDKNDAPALDGNGSISDSAVTFWNATDSPDGNNVPEGGVLAQLQRQTERNFLVDIGTSLTELKPEAFAGNIIDNLLGTDEEVQAQHIAWARGVDVDDDNNNGSTTDTRDDLMGDPLHSKPLVLTYGTNDIRILIGTNAGFLHMFKDSGDTVEESWAFMPQELMKNIPDLRLNQNGNPKIYGVDGSPVTFFKDKDGDGVIGSEDKVWVFFGLRRGGTSYYALDVTDPDKPELMWKIDSNTAGFGELGQSWSTPNVAYIETQGDKPVLIFGAGFSPNKDSTSVATPDNEGRGVFIVDAQTGSLVKSFGSEYGIEHSVPGSVSTLDSDYDGYTDRLYFADTGGNIWRADLVGADKSKWTMFKFADLADSIQSSDRRFFNEPVVARMEMRQVQEVTTSIEGETVKVTTKADVPFDAVVIGSGSRPHPLYEGAQDMLFMLRDMNTVSRLFAVDDVPAAITVTDLYQVTDTQPRTTIEQMEELQKDLTATKGWYYQLAASEKSLSPAVVLQGIAFFTSYVPTVEQTEDSCSLSGGLGRIYAFSLNYGILTSTIIEIPRIPDTPEVFITCVGEDCDKPCEGEDCKSQPGDIMILSPEPEKVTCKENCDLIPELKEDSSSNRPMRQYLVIDENL